MAYELYYWPIPFRGHPIRFVLAYLDVGWTDFGYTETAALKALPVAEKPYPFFAPPLLHDTETDVWLSQMPAILMYLGRRHDLISDPDQTLRLICDASDLLLEITRSHGALMWDNASWAAFREDRLPIWMRLHEALAGDGDWLFGRSGPGLADLALGALWHTMVDRLPPLRADLHENAPRIEALAFRVADLPAIRALRAKWAGSDPHYCAGQIEHSLLSVLNLR